MTEENINIEEYKSSKEDAVIHKKIMDSCNELVDTVGCSSFIINEVGVDSNKWAAFGTIEEIKDLIRAHESIS